MISALVTVGFAVAFVTGLVGIGGAIVLVPALLYLTPALGAGTLEMRTVAAITMVQVLFASLSALAVHWRQKQVCPRLVLWMGGGILVGSLAGGVFSKYASNALLEAVFASLALGAAGLMLLPTARDVEGSEEGSVEFNASLSALIACGVGFLAALVGAGGAFLLIPLMVHVLKVPTRLAVGSSLGIVFLAGLAGSAGKLLSGQIPLVLATALVAGAIPGAQLGARVSKRVNVRNLRLILFVIIALAGAKMWHGVLMGR